MAYLKKTPLPIPEENRSGDERERLFHVSPSLSPFVSSPHQQSRESPSARAFANVTNAYSLGICHLANFSRAHYGTLFKGSFVTRLNQYFRIGSKGGPY